MIAANITKADIQGAVLKSANINEVNIKSINDTSKFGKILDKVCVIGEALKK